MSKLMITAVVGLAASSAMAQPDYYNQGAFQFDALSGGKVLSCLEDFEYPVGQGVSILTDPLTQGVPNGAYTVGTLCPITLQSNTNGGGSPSPRGGGQPMVGWQGGIGFTATDAVTTNYFVDGMDLIMLNTDVYAVGFTPTVYSGTDTLRIDIYGLGNTFIASYTQSASSAQNSFFGYISNVPIERIHAIGLGGNAEGMDNIELWVIPTPGTAALLGLGGLAATRRRRA